MFFSHDATRQAQLSVPDVVLSMIVGEKRVAVARLPAHQLMYSSRDEMFVGRHCGLDMTVALRVLASIPPPSSPVPVAFPLLVIVSSRVQCTCAQPILHEREWSQLQQKLEQEMRVSYKLAGARPAAQVTLRMWLGRSSDDFGIDHMFDDKDCEIAAFAEIVRLYSTVLVHNCTAFLYYCSPFLFIRIRSTSSRS